MLTRRRPCLEMLEERNLLSVGGDVVIQWNRILLDAIRVDGTAPPPAARNMAIVQLAVFDAVNAIDRAYTPYLFSKPAPPGASPEAAAAVAAHDTLSTLYPAQKATFDAALASSLAAIPDGPAEHKGVVVGKLAARAILAARADDGSGATVTYTPGTGPGVWQPTPPGYAASQFPQWPDVTPFALTSGSQFRPGPPPALTSAEYAAAFNEVKDLGGVDSTARTPEQTQIALFWADNTGTATPPGHWNMIAEQVSLDHHLSVDQNVRLFALLDVALADAGIAAWDAKYAYNFWRPVTAIRNADSDGNPATAPDPTWAPLLATPAFPSYVSGHSTFSATAAAVLAAFFGTDDVHFTTTSDALPGVTRSFDSFSAAAEEAGQSRIYGGIHYQFDNQAGLALGQELGTYVFQHFLTPRSHTRRREADVTLARALRPDPHPVPALAAHAVTSGEAAARAHAGPVTAGVGLPAGDHAVLAADVLDAVFARLGRREDDPLFHPFA
jgi:membrane-associated phospholipid phosphatase